MASITKGFQETVNTIVFSQLVIQKKNEVTQLENEIALFRKLPEMARQRRDMEGVLRTKKRELSILECGFEPFNVSRNWHFGFLSNPGDLTDRLLLPNKWSLYRYALPIEAIEALTKARKLHVFDAYTVHSPNRELFTQPKVPVRIDPVLLGWIANDKKDLLEELAHSTDLEISAWRSTPVVATATTYLLSQWGLEKDLANAPTQP